MNQGIHSWLSQSSLSKRCGGKGMNKQVDNHSIYGSHGKIEEASNPDVGSQRPWEQMTQAEFEGLAGVDQVEVGEEDQ